MLPIGQGLHSTAIGRMPSNKHINPPLEGEEVKQLSTGKIRRVKDYNLTHVTLRFGYKVFRRVDLRTFWQRYARTTK